MKSLQRKRKLPTKSYSRRLCHYVNNCMEEVEPILYYIAKQSPFWIKYPVFKILKAVSRMFMLNQVELVFFANVFETTKWEIENKYVSKIAKIIYPIIADESIYQEDNQEGQKKQGNNNAASLEQFKKINLYILLVGYCAKYFFNKEINEYKKQVNRYCQDFNFVFKKWVKSYNEVNNVLSPKRMNQIFMQINQITLNEQLDYNLVIDVIIQLSPAYKNKQKKETQ